MSLETDLVLALVRAADGERRGDRPPRLDGRLPDGAAFLPLTRGQLAIVDADELGFLQQWSWWAVPSGRVHIVWYARCARGPMHRVLLAAPKGLVVDHWNGDTLDNRRANLRLCTQRENTLNRQSASLSGYRGVRQASGGRWQAIITEAGRTAHLGMFDSPIEAALVYDRRCRELHGAFALTNFPADSGT
jgi:hypothetical protein